MTQWNRGRESENAPANKFIFFTQKISFSIEQSNDKWTETQKQQATATQIINCW